MVAQERRAHPRIRDEAPTLKLNLGDFDSMTHTLDISASGVYCKVEKEIPLMSRLKLVLMLPDENGAKTLEVDGVVVREHPVVINGHTRHYDVAIFFDNLTEKQRSLISDYVAKRHKG